MTFRFNSSNSAEYSNDFVQGVIFLKEYSIPQALHNFQLAYDAVAYSDIYHNKYASYCGLARVLSGDRAGAELCRDAVRQEKLDGDVFLNLAYVEWHMKSRKRSVKILQQGLAVDHKHLGLKKFQQHLGKRSRQVISFVSRDSFLNKMLGKLVRRKVSIDSSWTFQQLM